MADSMRVDDGSQIDYAKTCFVVMPFGIKQVADREVDFDLVYDHIFAPAICAVSLPEGGNLSPRRTDRDFFASDIKVDMVQYLEYSRFVVADITGLNFNVGWELGARHRARESGTAIFRQAQFSPPFDISSIKAFPYEYEPFEEAQRSRELITRVLRESLLQNRLDSPVWLALVAQRQARKLDQMLTEAENAIRNLNWTGAMDLYRKAIRDDPINPLLRVRLGLLCRDRELWDEALEQFDAATQSSPRYGEAHREKGIAENKIAARKGEDLEAQPAPGEKALRRAVELNDKDFDAYAALGGVLKRAKRFDEALAAYEESLRISGGHPYPLLNVLKLRMQVTGRLALSGPDRIALMRAERVREAQTRQIPPFDSPWSFFDLAEIKLFQGDEDGFRRVAQLGLANTTADWQASTFLASLRLLQASTNELPYLTAAIQTLEAMLR